MAKCSISYLGSWAQSLTCQQPFKNPFFALLYLSNLVFSTSVCKVGKCHFISAVPDSRSLERGGAQIAQSLKRVAPFKLTIAHLAEDF